MPVAEARVGLVETDLARMRMAFGQAVSALRISEAEQCALLGMPLTAVKAHGLDPQAQERMALFVGACVLAGRAFPETASVEFWLRKPRGEAPFHGAAPLDLLLSGRLDGLLQVRDRLSAMVAVGR